MSMLSEGDWEGIFWTTVVVCITLCICAGIVAYAINPNAWDKPKATAKE